MEVAIEVSPSENYYRLADEVELRHVIGKRKYLFVYEFQLQDQRMHIENPIYVVPNQFPFVFRLERNYVQDNSNSEQLNTIIRQLNSIQRAQIVRSLIPKKIIFSNLSKKLRGEIEEETGHLCFKIVNPITGQELSSSSHSIVIPKTVSAATFSSTVDIEQFNSKNPTNRVSLTSNLNLVEFKFSLRQQTKNQRYVLYFRQPKAVKKNDLFYCFIKVKSDVHFKLYFIPQFGRSEEGKKATRELELSKVLVTVGPENLQSKPVISNGSFLSSVRRAKNSVCESNYRYNMLVSHPTEPRSGSRDTPASFARLQQAQNQLLPTLGRQSQDLVLQNKQRFFEMDKPDFGLRAIHSSLLHKLLRGVGSAKQRPLAEPASHETPLEMEELAVDTETHRSHLLLSEECLETGFAEEAHNPTRIREADFSGENIHTPFAQRIASRPTTLGRKGKTRSNLPPASKEADQNRRSELEAPETIEEHMPRGASNSLAPQNVTTETREHPPTEKSRHERERTARAATFPPEADRYSTPSLRKPSLGESSDL